MDLSHEALISGWPRLREWIGQRRVAELTRRRLEEKAGERQRLRQGGGAGGLLDAVELAEAWVKGPDAADLGVSDDLSALVADSRRGLARAAQRLRRRNQGLAVALAAALLAMAMAVAVYALNSLALQPDDPSVPLLLAVDAVETTWRTDNYVTANADRALQDAVAFAAPYRLALPRNSNGGVANSAAYSSDGKSIVTAHRDPPLLTQEEQQRYGMN